MTDPHRAPTRFVLSGTAQAAADPAGQSVRVDSRRATGALLRLSAVPGEQVVVLRLANGPALLLHPGHARDLLRAQGTALRDAVAPAAEVPGPSRLRWRALEQAAPTRPPGCLGDVMLAAVEVQPVAARDPAGDFAASATVQGVERQVEAGVYAWGESHPGQPGRGAHRLAQVPGAEEPLLVLVHGSLLDGAATFGALWERHPGLVRSLLQAYGGRLYALAHPTLASGVLDNALALVRALPQGARLHLLTHGRGGLIAEVLARLARQPTLGRADLAPFAGTGQAAQRHALQALSAELRAKGLRVERIVRVACPALGSSMASGRLDAWLSVQRWSMEQAGIAVPGALDGLLRESARRAADPTQLPGLADLLPDSALLRWLNAADEPVDGELRVIAGDLQGDPMTVWLKTLLADACFQNESDLGVATASMYGGGPRERGASFLLDQGAAVGHFAYFANERTAAASVAALLQPDLPAGFGRIGPLSWPASDASAVRAQLRSRRGAAAAAARPAVLVLPGLLASHLKTGGQRIWLSRRLAGGFARLAWRAGADAVQPDGPIGALYDDLMDHLADEHEVIAFACDWRRPLEDEARRLAGAVQAALDARAASGQPVRLLAHSAGALLARTLQLERPALWRRMMARPGARVLLLGPPNAGLWAPMQLLSGDDTLGEVLAAMGSPRLAAQARQLLAEMPGLLQLQAGLLDPALALDRSDTWQRLADADRQALDRRNWWHREGPDAAAAAHRWGLPPQAVLDQASALRRRLQAQLPELLAQHADQLLVVTGRAPLTPDGVELAPDGPVYLDVGDAGDGRVTQAAALLPGVRAWRLDGEHAELVTQPRAFAAYAELLAEGATARLDAIEPAGRAAGGAAAPAPERLRSRPSRRAGSARPPDDLVAVFRSARRPAPEVPDAGGVAALHLAVLNAHLASARQPLLLGHYRSLTLTGTERVVDGLLGGSLGAALAARVYPEAIGSHQVFANQRRDPANPWREPLPPGVVVVGLGDEGGLNEAELAGSVQQAVLAWVQRQMEGPTAPGSTLELAATLMGSGGMGMAPGASARAVARGVQQANERGVAAGWPPVDRLTLVELHLDRATEAWSALRLMASASPWRFKLAPHIGFGAGALRALGAAGYRGTEHDLLTITAPADDHIQYAMNTRHSRGELRAARTQLRLVRELVDRAATTGDDDPRLGHTLYQLLVPIELQPFLGGDTPLVLELDEGTAAIPWEMLDPSPQQGGGNDRRPWAVRAGLLRRWRSRWWRASLPELDGDDTALVLGEPLVDAQRHAPLPGAAIEARAVAAVLGAALGNERVTALLDQPDASAVIAALFSRHHRVLHLAGHAEPGPEGGLVLSGGTLLGPRELAQLRQLPELVFVSCGHLASLGGAGASMAFDRCAFAAALAQSLSLLGVRCVVVAGWAVQDKAASVFATTFYGALLAGQPFMAAVGQAREAAWNSDPEGLTWSAYQCYGDPLWTLRRAGSDDAAPPLALPRPDRDEPIASPPALALALERVATELSGLAGPAEPRRDQLRRLEAGFAADWGEIGAVAEAFGLAWEAATDLEAAIGWYQRALQSADASASMRVLERLPALQVRRAWRRLAQHPGEAGLLAAARAEIAGAAQTLQEQAAQRPSAERQQRAGSAWRRLAMLEDMAGQAPARAAALAQAEAAFAAAERWTAEGGPPGLPWSALDRIAVTLARQGAGRREIGLDPARTAAALARVRACRQRAPDFQAHAAEIELQLCEAAAQRRLADRSAALHSALAELHDQVAAVDLWAGLAERLRFALSGITRARAPAEAGPEQRAALQLLDRVQAYAGQAAPEMPPPATPAPGARAPGRRVRAAGGDAAARLRALDALLRKGSA